MSELANRRSPGSAGLTKAVGRSRCATSSMLRAASPASRMPARNDTRGSAPLGVVARGAGSGVVDAHATLDSNVVRPNSRAHARVERDGASDLISRPRGGYTRTHQSHDRIHPHGTSTTPPLP